MPIAKSARKPNAALMKPVQPDDTLAKIVGSKPLPRSELTKKIWDYIKKNKLQDAKKKTLINADDALKAVFGGKKQVIMSAVESKCITQGRIKMHHLGRRFFRWISVVVARVKWLWAAGAAFFQPEAAHCSP